MKITFYGATEGVTGSNTLVETSSSKFVIDCGLYQGSQENDLKNKEQFGYDPASVDFVILTHSHIDHIGRLPYLVKNGFEGKIYCTKPTGEFARIFLDDTCNLMLEKSKDHGVPPLYEQADVDKAISMLEVHDYYQEIWPTHELSIKFSDAGHILGSAIVELSEAGKKIVFSGDLGNPPVPILKDTDNVKADFVIMESTYGDRVHEDYHTRKSRLIEVIKESNKREGVLLVPAFALERTQEVLYELDSIIDEGLIEQIPIYLDSPLAIKAIDVYKNNISYFDKEAQEKYKDGENFFDFPSLKMIESRDESIAIDQKVENKIIMAGSGMSTGGRIVFHEKRFLSEPSTILLIIGYQVPGTLGRKLYDGENVVQINGDEIKVNATIERIESYSAHADQNGLLKWLGAIDGKPQVYLIHGEDSAKEGLSKKIKVDLEIKSYIPKEQETIEI